MYSASGGESRHLSGEALRIYFPLPSLLSLTDINMQVAAGAGAGAAGDSEYDTFACISAHMLQGSPSLRTPRCKQALHKQQEPHSC